MILPEGTGQLQLVESAPDRVVGGLQEALAQTSDDSALAGVRRLVETEARAQSAEWRALHYPAADLHGPFARPVLANTAADPNDAVSYYRLGDSVRLRLPKLADRAFY